MREVVDIKGNERERECLRVCERGIERESGPCGQ